jgi:hypothetical protein
MEKRDSELSPQQELEQLKEELTQKYELSETLEGRERSLWIAAVHSANVAFLSIQSNSAADNITRGDGLELFGKKDVLQEQQRLKEITFGIALATQEIANSIANSPGYKSARKQVVEDQEKLSSVLKRTGKNSDTAAKEANKFFINLTGINEPTHIE